MIVFLCFVCYLYQIKGGAKAHLARAEPLI
nr:MAG TPA: hypothetical protein [Caudoviricetes sp.]